MKLKNFMFCGASLLASTLLFSCSQENEPGNVPNVGTDSVEFFATVQLPDGIRTRAAAPGTVGEDGLYTFTREIDRLWYAVYYDGELLYNSEQEDAPNATKVSNGYFKVPFTFHNKMDFSKIYLFFWAGNAEDNVTTLDATSATGGININFAKRCVSVDPKYMNGDNSELEEYDSFAGYTQLATSNDVTTTNITYKLKRPFAQFHILSDEFTVPGLTTYANGVTVVPGFGAESATSTNYNDNLLSPTTWYFADEIADDSNYKQNEFTYSLTNYAFTNNLSGESPERVEFKERTMDYLTCYYVFAPVVKSVLKSAATDGGSEYAILNMAFYPKGGSLADAQFASVELPTDGIAANNKYIIYNKSASDGGNGGFLSSAFTFTIEADKTWGANEEMEL